MSKRFTKGQFGRLSFTDLNWLFEEVTRLRSQVDSLRLQDRTFIARQWFYAEITGHEPIPDTFHRWLYSWRKVGVNPNTRDFDPLMRPEVTHTPGGPSTGADTSPPTTLPGSSTTTLVEINSTINGDPFALCALNGSEKPNTDIFAGGIDITLKSYTGCDLQPFPVPVGTVVEMRALHGVLSTAQLTGGGTRSPIGYMFNETIPHDKIDATHPGMEEP